MRVWRVGRLEHDPIRTYRAAGELWSVAVSADGSKLAAGGFDGNVWVWETGRDEPTRTPMHRGIVHTLAFAPDGRSLVSGGHDGTVRFLDLELMQERFNVSSGSEAKALVFSPDGSALAVAGNDGGVRLFRTTSPAGVVEDCRRRWAAAPKDATARRDLVAALWAFYLDRTRAKDSPGARRGRGRGGEDRRSRWRQGRREGVADRIAGCSDHCGLTGPRGRYAQSTSGP